MKEYKVGDKVTIKSLDWYNENKDKYGTVYVPGSFIRDMSKYCGKTTVITEVLATPNRYHVECDTGFWSWSAEMFEETEEEAKEETMKYKVGDKVRLKSQEWYDNHEKDDDGFIRNEEVPSFNPKMCTYLGKIATIKVVSKYAYEIDLDKGYWSWGDYMIECKVDDVELKEEEPTFKEGDFVKIKSEEWYEENKDDGDEVIENDITFDPEYCGKIGKIVEYDSSDETYKVQFDPDDESNYQWFTSNWMNKADKPDNWDDESYDDEDDDPYNDSIEEGDWVLVADKYSEESPREDWTVAKFVEARAKGIDTEEGIWNYCIEWTVFEPEDWEETIKHIYEGKDKKLIKVNRK